ncbi:MAG: helix-turn-helix domain-containing protein [Xanthobacteraceae bacterium]|jgi:DNA-binding HxlR family transcriptional regulator
MIPSPGRRTRGSRTGKSIMAFLDLIGRRWALRILWELNTGPAHFRALQAACGASPSVINQRLAELKAWSLIALNDDGYVLTPSGRELRGLMMPLNDWCKRHVADGGKPKRRGARRS